MSHIYDFDSKYIINICGYSLILGKRKINEDMGCTLITIDIGEKGVSISRVTPVNEKAMALADAHKEMIRNEMMEILNISDEHAQMWMNLIQEYSASGVDKPVVAAYSELRTIISNKSVIDDDRDRDVG